MGANWKALWRRGVERAHDAYWSTYVWERGDCWTNKTFIVASDATVSVCKKMIVYYSTGLADLKKYCQEMKKDWEAFNKNPCQYRNDLIHVVRSFDLTSARDHLLDNNAFPNANKNIWKPSEADLWTIVEKDLIFQQKAFVIVTFNPRRMETEEAILHLREDWRHCTTQNGCLAPVDYEAFTCRGCNTFHAFNYFVEFGIVRACAFVIVCLCLKV